MITCLKNGDGLNKEWNKQRVSDTQEQFLTLSCDIISRSNSFVPKVRVLCYQGDEHAMRRDENHLWACLLDVINKKLPNY